MKTFKQIIRNYIRWTWLIMPNLIADEEYTLRDFIEDIKKENVIIKFLIVVICFSVGLFIHIAIYFLLLVAIPFILNHWLIFALIGFGIHKAIKHKKEVSKILMKVIDWLEDKEEDNQSEVSRDPRNDMGWDKFDS